MFLILIYKILSISASTRSKLHICPLHFHVIYNAASTNVSIFTAILLPVQLVYMHPVRQGQWCILSLVCRLYFLQTFCFSTVFIKLYKISWHPLSPYLPWLKELICFFSRNLSSVIIPLTNDQKVFPFFFKRFLSFLKSLGYRHLSGDIQTLIFFFDIGISLQIASAYV